eukprot:9080985-Karenia_brevis.AAC.1
MQFTLGFDFKEALESRRLAGWAAEQATRLGVRKQAPVLSLQAVAQMERDICAGEVAKNEKIVIGASLFLLSARARFSDVKARIGLETSEWAFELGIRETKTAKDSRLPKALMGLS